MQKKEYKKTKITIIYLLLIAVIFIITMALTTTKTYGFSKAIEFLISTIPFNSADAAQVLPLCGFDIVDECRLNPENVNEILFTDEDRSVVKIVADFIDALPTVESLVLGDAIQTEEARLAYDSLTEAQKTLVLNYSTLIAVENQIEVLKITPPPSSSSSDTTPPVITLNGDASITLNVGDVYGELGATATDNVDTSVTVIIAGAVDTTIAGIYTTTYNATDTAGNVATEVVRTITVGTPPLSSSDATPPVITLNGDASIVLNVGDIYEELGATVTDNLDTSVEVVIGGSVDTAVAGTYTVTYNATDAAGNTATEVTRTVTVGTVIVPPTADTTAPVITLIGDTTITLNVGDIYEELGATATDNVDTSVEVVIGGSVDTSVAGTYTITYNATDVAGNTATEVTRTVTINEVIPPPAPDPAP